MANYTDYILHLADNAVVMGQRNGEWCGLGPVLEEDLALANMSLDHIGQARLLYQLAATLKGGDATEDSLAYFRNEQQYLNYTLVELPHRPALSGYAKADRDYAVTITCNFLYSALMVLVWDKLQQSKDTTLAAIAEKSLKEIRYHLRHSRGWLVRFGDGTQESYERAQAAINHLMPYTEEFWQTSPVEATALEAGVGVDVASLRDDWNTIVDSALDEASLTRPQAIKGQYISEGKKGLHSEHLGYLLSEMQSLARAHPGCSW